MERLYRHDLEGLIWILPWVFLQFSEKKRKSYQLQPWRTGDYNQCREKKNDFLLKRNNQRPQETWKNEWDLAFRLLRWIYLIIAKKLEIADSENTGRMDKNPSLLMTMEVPSTEAHGLEFFHIWKRLLTITVL